MSASVAYPRRLPLDNEQGRLWCTVSRATYANEDRQPSWFRVGVPSKEATDLVSGLVRLTGWPLELLTELLAVQASQDGQTWPPVAAWSRARCAPLSALLPSPRRRNRHAA
jgi:hypothetical protein